jgi:hypothetical protein
MEIPAITCRRSAFRFVAASAFTVLASFNCAASHAASYEGAPVHIGQGNAHVVVRTNSSGLPTALNNKTAEGSWEYPLPMPVTGPKTGYSEVMIDWNPHGHPPPHVYTVPHFDFHFYGIDKAAVQRISFKGPTDPATKVSDPKLVPAGYKVFAETAVNQMGVHAIDTAAPEFHGKPFTATFIYGYYKGRLIFLEPMVTRSFLQTKPNFYGPVKIPAKYSRPGYYPTSYSVKYDGGRHAYVIEIAGLKHWRK